MPPLPAGVPRIEVTFLIDANGILNVTARDMRTGQSQSIEVKPSHGLLDEEVEQMIGDSFKFAAEDITARKLIEARLDGGALIAATEKSLGQGSHLIAADEVAAIRAALAALATAKDGADPRAIRARMADVEQAAHHLTTTLMDDSLKQALQNKKLSELP
jgi:molecular chaperone DnaK (HSP70)